MLLSFAEKDGIASILRRLMRQCGQSLFIINDAGTTENRQRNLFCAVDLVEEDGHVCAEAARSEI